MLAEGAHAHAIARAHTYIHTFTLLSHVWDLGSVILCEVALHKVM